MPTWGWVVLIVIASAIMIPIKMKILKKMMEKKNKNIEEDM